MRLSKKLIQPTLITLLAVALLGNAYLYNKYTDAKNNDPTNQTEQIVATLNQTVDTPDETPSVLTVVDKTKLQDSQIASKAENGDKILLFQKAGEVYIYRPDTKKLISILTLTPAATTTPVKGTEATQPPKPKTTTNR